MNISYQNRLRYVYKVTSSRIRKANYHLNLTYHDASINGELAAIGNHQVFRFIDQLRSQKRMEEQRIEIQHELRRVKALKTTVQHNFSLFTAGVHTTIHQKAYNYRDLLKRRWIVRLW
ncbi:hypothetical protein [Paenibacillus sp. FSL K6-1558]|uniref:hypothetical protein n=1 Tax=Paenibacillus sp. FSL K6-1558 TaxID=2921473 RepID=UPI0030F6737B